MEKAKGKNRSASPSPDHRVRTSKDGWPMRISIALLLAIAVAPGTAMAKDRDYCPDRPGMDTPPCTMEPGRASVEVGLGDWTLDRNQDERQDTIDLGDVLVRYGIADHGEVQVGWTALGLSRARDRITGKVEKDSGVGDVTLAVRRNLLNPDGSGFSVAVMPFVTLPVGRKPIGAGDWSTGLLIPASYQLSDTLSLSSTTEFDAAVDQDGSGRHIAVSETVGANLKLTSQVTATVEYQALDDRDPQGHSVEQRSGLSLGWQPSDNLQLDVGGNVGLNHNAADVEVYFGFSRLL